MSGACGSPKRLVPPKKARRLERSWAAGAWNEALPLIDEERFAPSTELGSTFSKRSFTDDEALERLEFNLLLDMEETHLPQKTLPTSGSPDAARRWPAGFPGDHGAHPGAGYTPESSGWAHPHRATYPQRPVLWTMRLFLRAVSQEHPELRREVHLCGGRKKHQRPTTRTPARGRVAEGSGLYRLVSSWHGCNWRSPAAGEAAAGAVCGGQQEGRAPRRGRWTQGKGRCPSPSGPIPCNRPTTRRPPTRQGVRGTGGGDLPCGERHPVDHSCRGDPIQRELDTDETVPLVDGLAERKVRPDELFGTRRMGRAATPSRPRAGGRNSRWPAPGNSHEGEGDGPPPLTGAFQILTSPGPAGHGVPRRAPVRRGVRAGGCAGAGRGPLCQGNMRALPLAVPLPGEAGPACGGLRPQGGPGEGEHRGAAAGRGHRGVAQAVCHKGRDRWDKLRAEARPRAWALAGARGPSGAACRLPQGIGVQLQADGPCTPGGDGKHGSAGGRDGTCCRSRVRAPLHSFHRAP